MKRIAILGSTGSIGRQTLEVVRMHPGDFSVEAISANRNVELLLKQAKEFNPSIIAITDEFAGNKFLTMYKGNAEVIIGKDSISEIVKVSDIDLVLISVVGISGLKPTLNAINSGKEIALANKETLVAGGSIVMNAAKNKKIVIKPVDSEHSAIFQCLM